MRRPLALAAVAAIALPLMATAASADSDPVPPAAPDAVWCVGHISVGIRDHTLVTTPVICVPGP